MCSQKVAFTRKKPFLQTTLSETPESSVTSEAGLQLVTAGPEKSAPLPESEDGDDFTVIPEPEKQKPVTGDTRVKIKTSHKTFALWIKTYLFCHLVNP